MTNSLKHNLASKQASKQAYSLQIKQSGTDEYYSPQNVVDMIVPHVLSKGYKSVWCPFDTAESRFVKTFQDLGFEVAYGHIETGQDFFDYQEPQGEIVVSNPPFSKRDAIFKRLYEMKVPFALVMNFNGLFDSKTRSRLFRENRIEILVPYGRMKFIHKDRGHLNQPNFQSVYVCSGVLDQQITFSDADFSKRNTQMTLNEL